MLRKLVLPLCCNADVRNGSLGAITDVIDNAGASQEAWRAHGLKCLLAKPCLRLTGLCPDGNPDVDSRLKTMQHAQDDSSMLYDLAAYPSSSITALDLSAATGVLYCRGGTDARVYIDGSCKHPRH